MSRLIIFIGHDATQTGAPRSLLKIVRWFKDSTDFDVFVLLNRGGPMLGYYESVASTVVWSEDQKYNFKYSIVRRLFLKVHRAWVLRKIRKIKPVCLFINTGVNAELVQLLASVTHVPVVSRIPELEGFMRRNSLGGSVQRILKLSARIIAVSVAVRDNLVARYHVPVDRISVAYGACDVATIENLGGSLRERIGANADDSIICGCGTMDWRKGYDLFVQVAYKVLKKFGRNDVHFVWVGTAVSMHTKVEFEYEVELLGLQGNFHQLGELNNPSEAFRQCNVFFLSSREDPFPLVMLESSRQRLPIVCFEGSGGATEFVTSEIGAVVPMADVDAAAEALLLLVDDKYTLNLKGPAAARKSNEFTVDRMCAEVHRVVLLAIAESESEFGPQT